MTQKMILSLMVPLICIKFNGYSQEKFTLKQIIDSTLSRNLQIKQGQLDLLLATENLQQSKYNLLPSINISPQASFNWGRTLDVSTYNYINQRVFLFNGSIGVQMPLFQGGLLLKQIVENKLLLESSRNNVSKIKDDLTLLAITEFFQTITDEELLQASKQQVVVAKLTYEHIKKGFNAGNKSLADLAQAQAQQATSELNETNFQNQYDLGMLTLKQLMKSPFTKIELEKPNIEKLTQVISNYDTVDLWQEVKKVNPSIKLATIQKDAAFQNIRVAKASLYPSLILFSSLGSNFSDARTLQNGIRQVGFDTIGYVNGTNQRVLSPAYTNTAEKYSFKKQFSDNFYQTSGVLFQLPVFNHFAIQNSIKKAKIDYQKAELSVEAVNENIRKVFNQALADLDASKKRLIASQHNHQAFKQVLYINEKRYNAGLVNSLDYSISLSNFNKAEFDLIQANYELIFREKVIDYYLGKSLGMN